MHDAIERLRDNILGVFLGNSEALDRVLCSLLARGHILIEDVPGVGKTILAMAIARSIRCQFTRIQLTPDLLPNDVLGVSVYDRSSGEFVFKKGPIFSNIVLADEINRTTPRTQTALLEAMNEGSVSIDGRVHELEQPFLLLATQNPFDFEGTYPLPENQLDRFLIRISLGYPSPEDEARVLELRPARRALQDLEPVMDKSELVKLQNEADQVRVDRSLLDYIVNLARATRHHEQIMVGLSPRGSLALAQAARATALYHGRDYAIPEDVLSNVEQVCAHRIVTRAAPAGAGHDEAVMLLREITDQIESPV